MDYCLIFLLGIFVLNVNTATVKELRKFCEIFENYSGYLVVQVTY